MTLLESFAPAVLTAGLWLLLGPMLPRSRPWARAVVLVAFLVVVARYLPWRLTETVLPVSPLTGSGFWIWLLFAIECIFVLDMIKLLVVQLRVVDRSAEADAYQAALQARPRETWPSVDVYIPTYNEPLDVLERAIVGSLGMDYPNFKVWVLDDGRRDWLEEFCRSKGAGYLRRGDNAHAKAGNINAALARTDGDLITVFDADFVPREDFLRRTVGFFDDPKIGILQTPQHFFNRDPVQRNLWLFDIWPDEQRQFFDKLAPALDAWDAMFCCGSCAVMRRRALDAIGGMPTASITEDILTTLSMHRHGYITRYLSERLSIGLAAESLEAFFVQRSRWCQGGIQTLYLRDGPLGPGLEPSKRILLFPIYWVFHLPARLIVLMVPILYFWLDLDPLYGARSGELFYWQLPVLVFNWAATLWAFGRSAIPLLQEAPGTLISLKLLPTVASSLVRPFGRPFRVTPKGSGAARGNIDWSGFIPVMGLFALTVGGMLLNLSPWSRIVSDESLFTIATLWAGVNAVILALAALICVENVVERQQERFPVDIGGRLIGTETETPIRIVDLSLGGATITRPTGVPLHRGSHACLAVPAIGTIHAKVLRVGREEVGLAFAADTGDAERDALIRVLYTGGIDNAARVVPIREVLAAVANRLFGSGPSQQ